MIRADINYYTQTRKTNEKTKHVKRISLLPLSYTVKPPLMATAPYNGHFCFVPADRPYIESLQRQRPQKHVSNCQNNLFTTASFFCDWWKKPRMIRMASWVCQAKKFRQETKFLSEKMAEKVDFASFLPTK